MQAGKLRHRVTIQQLVAGSPQQHGTGEPDVAWTDVATVWAGIRPLGGRELFLAQQAASRVEAEIEIRYRSGLDTAMRVVHGSVVYDIAAIIDPEERHARLILRCARGLNEG